MGEVNQRISSRSLDAMTTAAVVAYYSQENEARVSYAGHPPVLYRRATDTSWTFARPPDRKGISDGFPMNIPLAIESDTLYGQFAIPMTTGDQLFVYTDGVIDAPSPEGESFGLARLKKVLDANIKTPLTQLKSVVLRELHQHTKKELTHDDITMIAMEIGSKANASQKEELMAPEKQMKAFDNFYNSVRNNKILDSKTTLLIQMATAMAVGCYP
ncbi:MAG: PP2C family protein-serine/threonine phosphatase [Desulfobacteraceae bacterium]|jgi:sigma-B regulation protein RsbU (phosphoserine phosphatase)